MKMIDDHLAWMALAGMTHRTIDARRAWLHRLDDALPWGLCYASADEMTDTIGRMAAARQWSRQSLATYGRHTRGFYRWAIEAGRLAPPDPSASLPRPRVPQRSPRPVRDDVLARILADAVAPYRLWSLLAAYGGLRCVEIARLRREHVDARAIRIMAGKGDAPGTVPTHPAIWDAVRDLPPGPLAWTRTGRPASARHVSMAWWRHAHTVLGVDTSLHKLRHWYATQLLQQTGNLALVQRLLRHQSMQTTLTYAQLADADVSSAVAALPSIGDLR